MNNIWGAERLFEWNTPVWEHDLEQGLRILRLAIDTHLTTSQFALPLLIRKPGGLVVEMTDSTRDYNPERYRVCAFYDLAKTAVIRLAFAQSEELAPHGCTAVALTPGWIRSEMMLDNHEATEANWRDGAATNPHFAAISESPRFVGRAVAALAADPEVHRRNGRSFSPGRLAREYGFTDWASPVWYAPAMYTEFLWVSEPNARHSRNLAARPEVGIVIFDSTVSIGGAEAVYMEAAAEQLAGAELERGIAIYSRRSKDVGARG